MVTEGVFSSTFRATSIVGWAGAYHSMLSWDMLVWNNTIMYKLKCAITLREGLELQGTMKSCIRCA